MNSRDEEIQRTAKMLLAKKNKMTRLVKKYENLFIKLQ